MDNFDRVIQAGRMLNDISLDELGNDYKRKVQRLVVLLMNQIAVFDCDGTLTEFAYAKDRLLPCRDDELGVYSVDHNIYEYARSIRSMQYVINELNPEDVYILTVTEPSLVEKKNLFIERKFPTVSMEHVIHVRDSDEKMEVLKSIYEARKKDIIFVEDTAKTLLTAEELLYFVKGYHISSLLA